MTNIKVYYRDHIEMNGKGITKIIFEGEEVLIDSFVEGIYEDIGSVIPEVYKMSLYIGNPTAFTYGLMFDYSPDEVSDEIVDKVNNYMDEHFNIDLIKEEERPSCRIENNKWKCSKD